MGIYFNIVIGKLININQNYDAWFVHIYVFVYSVKSDEVNKKILFCHKKKQYLTQWNYLEYTILCDKFIILQVYLKITLTLAR